MGANLVFLGYALLVFGLFNYLFIRGFFKTGYYIGKPFIVFSVVCMLLIGLAETLHHVPGLGSLNAFGTDHIGLQCAALCAGIACFALLTGAALKQSVRSFERIDL